MRSWERIDTRQVDGFDVNTYWTPEDLDPRDHFEDEDIEDIIEGIESWRYRWFTAKVTASKSGIELGSAYLGACLYESASDFCNGADYHEDMIAEAVNEAKTNIKKLIEG